VTVTGGAMPDFGVAASPAAVTVAQSGSAATKVTTTAVGGFSGSLSLAVSGVPDGVTATLSTTSVPAPGNGTTTLTFAASAAAATGTYSVAITASGGGVTHTAAVTLTVKPPSPPVVLLSDGFEGSGWTLQTVSGGAAWKVASAGVSPTVAPRTGSKLADFNSHTATAGGQGRIYRSTGFAVPAGASAVTLSFWVHHDTGAASANDRVQAQVSTGWGAWTNVGAAVSRYAASPGWSQVTVDLTAYRGKTVRLGFLGISAHGNDCSLDDVAVVAQ